MSEIPPEFLGKARAFRDALDRDEMAFDERYYLPLYTLSKALSRGQTIRPEILNQIYQQWRKCPEAVKVERKRDRLNICEIRLASGDVIFPNGGREQAVLIEETHIVLDRHEIKVVPFVQSSFGLHAIARRFQRGFCNDVDAIKQDMFRCLPENWTIATSSDRAFDTAVSTRDGYWAGKVSRNLTSFAARTFVPLVDDQRIDLDAALALIQRNQRREELIQRIQRDLRSMPPVIGVQHGHYPSIAQLVAKGDQR